MKHTIVTATDTGEAVILRGGITTNLLHHIALAWVRPEDRHVDSRVTEAVRQALGPRSRCRRYVIDRSQASGITLRFSPYKRPDTLDYRGAPARFVDRHAHAATLHVAEIIYPVVTANAATAQQLIELPKEFT